MIFSVEKIGFKSDLNQVDLIARLNHANPAYYDTTCHPDLHAVKMASIEEDLFDAVMACCCINIASAPLAINIYAAALKCILPRWHCEWYPIMPIRCGILRDTSIIVHILLICNTVALTS